jgi:hypothetical protein
MGLKGHVMVFSDEGHFADRRDAGLLLGARLRHTLGGDLLEPTLVVGFREAAFWSPRTSPRSSAATST